MDSILACNMNDSLIMSSSLKNVNVGFIQNYFKTFTIIHLNSYMQNIHSFQSFQSLHDWTFFILYYLFYLELLDLLLSFDRVRNQCSNWIEFQFLWPFELNNWYLNSKWVLLLSIFIIIHCQYLQQIQNKVNLVSNDWELLLLLFLLLVDITL